MSESHDLTNEKSPSQKVSKLKKVRKKQANNKKIKTVSESILKQVNDSCNKHKNQNTTQIQNRKCKQLLKENFILDVCRDCILNLRDFEESEEQECRFVGWKKYVLNSDFYEPYGFLEVEDCTDKDNSLWDTFCEPIRQERLDYEKILNLIGDQFLKTIENEIEFRHKFVENRTWKRLIAHTREICDQCSTTIFNSHMACKTCGFSVCIDCFELRTRNLKLNKGDRLKEQDFYNWCYCYIYDSKNNKITKTEHEPNELIYVQFIPPHILNKIFWEYKTYKDSVKNSELLMNVNSNSNYSTIDSYDMENRINDEKLTEIFEEKWFSKTPIVIKNIHKFLNPNLWTPESFSNEFGHLEINLINCRNNHLVPNVSLKTFWSGFENIEERIRDKNGRPLILKLKDWPASDDFKNILPTRFDDLMKNLPIRKFTHRNGTLNLVSNLPDFFSLPDLGPKLYIAYSSADTPKEGTTNLHVDISDAVNLMIYVGDPHSSVLDFEVKKPKRRKLLEEENKDSKIDEELHKLIKESNCSKEQMDRFFINKEKPGALWHIFKPEDADNIRTFLTLNDINKGKKVINENDPIHDQVNYIDNKMLTKLKKEYDVEVFTILQFLGDAIFIPSGAPHQVRNLSSCIKVAGDFVSPQGIENCITITDQFRKLSERHVNHQDKLQIKNIIYHSIKKCLSVLNDSQK